MKKMNTGGKGSLDMDKLEYHTPLISMDYLWHFTGRE